MTDTDIVFLTNEAEIHNTSTTHKTDIQWLFAHGAGAPMDSNFMNVVAEGVAAAGITVKRFEFPYMKERRETGKKRPPNRAPELLQHFMRAIEQAGGFKGRYFVLHGHLSPIDGIGPEMLGMDRLETRVREQPPEEVILATNLTVEGEATAHYIYDLLQSQVSTISRIAHGVPLGGELEYIDGGTIVHAMQGRRNFS